jgi:hypothetical protein
MVRVIPCRCITSALLLLAACVDTPVGSKPSGPELRVDAERIRGSLTRSFAAELLSNGDIPTAIENQPGAEISSARAVELALAYVRQFGTYNRSSLEQGAGMHLNFDSLHAESRVFYATSPYEDVNETFSKPSAKLMGGYYLITLSQSAIPVMRVAVSAKSSDLQIQNGRVHVPTVYGNEFWIIPIGPHSIATTSPEQAVVIAHDSINFSTSERPVLVIPERENLVPQYSTWRLVGTRGAGGGNPKFPQQDTVYVTYDRQIMRRAAATSNDVRLLWLAGGDGKRASTLFKERSGLASELVPFNSTLGAK